MNELCLSLIKRNTYGDNKQIEWHKLNNGTIKIKQNYSKRFVTKYPYHLLDVNTRQLNRQLTVR